MTNFHQTTTCPEPFELSCLHDGECSSERELELLHHLESCPSCKDEFEMLRGISSSVAELPLLACPEDVAQKAVEQIRTTSRDRTPEKTGRAPVIRMRRFAMAATIVVALGAGALLLRPTAEPEYSAEEVAAARADVLLAFALVEEVNRETGAYLSNSVIQPDVVEPIKNSLNPLFNPNQ